MSKKRRNKEEVLALLNDALKEYIADTDLIWYRYYLNMNSFSTSAYANWIKKDDKDIIELYTILENLQESRIINGMLNKTSNINTTTSIYFTKVHLKWIEHEKQMLLDQNKRQQDLDREIIISFNSDD